jgi:DnaJ-class molecular chaperone
MQLYAELGVDQRSTQEEIRVAYRRLAMAHHPDKAEPSKKAASEERFKRVNAAYDVLGDPSARAKYDDSVPHPQGFQHPQGHQDPGDMYRNAHPAFMNFFGGHPFSVKVVPRTEEWIRDEMTRRKEESDTRELTLSFHASAMDVWSGARGRVLSYQIDVLCGSCYGPQAPVFSKTCERCKGSGVRHEISHHFGTNLSFLRVDCEDCRGMGRVPGGADRGGVCTECGGRGETSVQETATVDIPSGMVDGYELPGPLYGSRTAEGNKKRPIRVLVRHVFGLSSITDHPWIKDIKVCPKEGAPGDVRILLSLPLESLLSGFGEADGEVAGGREKGIRLDFSGGMNLEEAVLHVSSKGYFNPKNSMIIQNRGYPTSADGGRRGTVLIDVEVVYPDTLSSPIKL